MRATSGRVKVWQEDESGGAVRFDVHLPGDVVYVVIEVRREDGTGAHGVGDSLLDALRHLAATWPEGR